MDSQARQNAANGRLADLTPDGVFAHSAKLHGVRKIPEFLNLDDVEKV
jgi:hypothetical protein